LPGINREAVTIIKRNSRGEETWRYAGVVLQRAPQAMLIEASFNRDDILFYGMHLNKGDRFVEAFFANRFYNIFEIHDYQSDELKGWYCNVTRPAEFLDRKIDYVDLALDLLIFPDRTMLLLDQDEFEEQHLDDAEQQIALAAVDELKEIFQQYQDINLDSLFAKLTKNSA
jgi:protein associated with RNAse G/E